MNLFIRFAKFLMVIIWGILLVNLVFPFPGKAAMAFYFLLAFIFAMHSIQLLAIYGAFAEKLKLSKKEALAIFLFGVFSLWQMRKRLL